MSEQAEFILDREFNAPREMVWRAWTEPQILSRWYGPNVETVIHKFDLTPGGLWLNEMKMQDRSSYSRITFDEVAPVERLVWRDSASDEDWNPTSNPMMPDWPRTILTTVTFEDLGQKTNVRLKWTPFEASDAEIACFMGAKDHLGGGWGSGYAIIDEILEELKTGR